MATLQVTNLQNTASTVTNVSLLADGTTTLVLNATGTARTGGIRYNAGNLEVYTSGAVWVPVGGGGVSAVTASAPLVSSGGATPNLTLNAATTALPGSVQLADATASQAGTSATLVNTPAFSVPKDASGMTGAAILPSGTNLQRAAIASPVAGMTRFNTDYTPDSLEVYDGTNWKQVAYVPDLGTLTDLIPTNGQTLPAAGVYNNITINAGVTVNVPGTCYLRAKGTVTINGTILGNGVGLPGARLVSANGFNPQGNYGQGIGTGTSNFAPVAGKVYGFYTSLSGSSGSGGDISSTTSGAIGSSGGAAGGTFIIVAEGPISVGASASIQVNGGNSSPGTASGAGAWAAGGGGGSGGLILLQSLNSMTLAAGASLSVAGGNGSNGVAGTSGGSTSNGGGGGGGGYIVLNAPNMPSGDASTKVLTGGTAGSLVASSSYLFGGSGAGFGGAGGGGGTGGGAGAAQNGSPGQVLTNVYI